MSTTPQPSQQAIADAYYWLGQLRANGQVIDTPEAEQYILSAILRMRLNRFHGMFPSAPQMAYLLYGIDAEYPGQEVMFGGEGYSGKTVGHALRALQFYDVPNHATLIIRKTIPDMRKPGNLLPLLHQWLDDKEGWSWNEENLTWIYLPTGKSIVFTYMQNFGDWESWKSASIQDVLWEEATDFPQEAYQFMFRSLRYGDQRQHTLCPLRVGLTSNPGGEYHEYYKALFLPDDARRVDTDGRTYLLVQDPYEWKDDDGDTLEFGGRVYIHAVRSDNPAVDNKRYKSAIAHMSERDQLRFGRGDWDLPEEGALFDMEVTKMAGFYLPYRPTGPLHEVRYWDKAYTEGGQGATTAGVRMLRLPAHVYGREYWVVDMVQFRHAPLKRNQMILDTAYADGQQVKIWIEQEPAAGKESVQINIRELAGFVANPDPAVRDKVLRAEAFAAQWNNNNVGMVRGSWNNAFLESLKAAPNGRVKDPWDAAGGAFNKLALANIGAPAAAGRPREQPVGARFM